MNTRNHTRSILLILFLLTTAVPLWSQSDFWEPCPGPEGTLIADITIAPDGTIYTIGNVLHRSTDGGYTWTRMSNISGPAIIADRKGVLFTTMGSILYSSTDGGSEWSATTDRFTGFDIGMDIPGARGFAISKGGTTFGISESFVHRCRNGEWEAMSRKGLPNFLTQLATDSLGGILVGTNLGLFLLDEGADTGWVQVKPSGGGWRPSSVAYSRAGYWFCSEEGIDGGSTKRLYRTSRLDSSNTQWETVVEFSSPYSIRSLCVAPSGDIYAIAGPNLLRSSDNGSTWETSPIPSIGHLRFTGNGDEMIAASWGIVRSNDSGRSWQNSFSGMKTLPIYDLALTSTGTLYVATEVRGILRSTDGGDTWDSVSDQHHSPICVSRRGSLLAMRGGILYRSSDEGESWQPVFDEGRWNFTYLLAGRSGAIYARPEPYNQHLRKSTDDGITWKALENAPMNWQRVVEDSTGALWHPDWNGLGRSTDGGEQWDTVAIPTPEISCWSMTVQPSGALVAATDSGVIRSVDNGQTWRTISVERPSGRQAQIIESVGDDNLFVADSGSSLYRSTNSGESWQPVPFPARGPYRIGADTNGFVYVATYQGLFRSRSPQVLSSAPDVSDAIESIHAEFRDGRIIVRSNAVGAGMARVTIMTVDGRLVSACDLDLRGSRLDAAVPVSELPSGAYLCTVRIGSLRCQTKFVVVR